MSNQSGSTESIKKRNKKSKDVDNLSAPETLTKEEQQIARYLRLSCPYKQGNLHGMKVEFFIANKLVDCLMESKWGPGKTNNNKQSLLSNRQACVAFMQRLMNKQLFHRAIKVYKDETSSSIANLASETPNLKKRKANLNEKDTNSPSPQQQQKESQQSQKRKFKLEMHEDHRFIDANEPYVWVYDPTSTKTYIIGSLLILGSIGICLFPLWPSQVREGVYYISLAGASFLGAILGLAVFKYILFGFIWTVTLGSVHFWLLPNLTEDVGFLESFIPVYKCTSSSKSKNKAIEKQDNNQEAVNNESKSEKENTLNDDKQEQKEISSNQTPKQTPKALNKEISKSTIEIDSISDSPVVTKRKQSTKEEDDFELVDGDE